jgi:phospholipase C
MCGNSSSSGDYQDRCGFGPRQPLFVISPCSKMNYIDHQITDLASVLKFIEENWNLGQIGNQSFDAKSGSLLNMFDFKQHPRMDPLILDPSAGSKSKMIGNMTK